MLFQPEDIPNDVITAGCDEAGRGCLAGPVVAAAVILDPGRPIEGLNDSKQLTETERNTLRNQIESCARSWAVAFIDPRQIDKENILNASFSAMHKAIAELTLKPSLLLIDGNRFNPYLDIPHRCIIKGDSKILSIAAASILAKTWRDEYMSKLHREFPDYLWDKNKGYPTAEHRSAIRTVGISVHHRMSFRLLPDDQQGKLF